MNILSLLTLIRIASTYLTIILSLKCDSNYQSSYSLSFIFFFFWNTTKTAGKAYIYIFIFRFNTDFIEHASSMMELISLDPALNTKHQLQRVILHHSSCHTNVLLSAAVSLRFFIYTGTHLVWSKSYFRNACSTQKNTLSTDSPLLWRQEYQQDSPW